MKAASIASDLGAALGPGRVLAAHRRACTLETDDGALITLADPALGNGPATIVVKHGASLGRFWPAGARFWPVGDSGLAFAAGPSIDWRDRPIWSAADSAPLGPPRFRPATALAAALAASAVDAGLLPGVLGMRASALSAPAPAAQRALLARAAPLLAALPDPAAAEGLIGLGPGLTPAGDDLVAGLLLTLHYAGHPAAGPLRRIAERADTSRLGRAILRWAASGLAGEHVLALLRGLFSQPAGQALGALPAVLDHGATSGADLAAGILIGLRLID